MSRAKIPNTTNFYMYLVKFAKPGIFIDLKILRVRDNFYLVQSRNLLEAEIPYTVFSQECYSSMKALFKDGMCFRFEIMTGDSVGKFRLGNARELKRNNSENRATI